jgi:outer membrane receptor for ferrienterochelin and colicin
MNLVAMKKIEILGIILIFAVISSLANSVSDKKGQISGHVFDNNTKHSIEYATVALSDLKGKIITGTITDNTGYFYLDNIKNGTYNLTVSFLGYEDITIKNVVLNDMQSEVTVNDIYITPASENLEEVTVVSNVAPVQYKIDKKIINVSKQFSTISGTAVDVLQNIPSVRVDIEGNVSLRGSSGFTVLIDGRPTILDANDALQQMPASNIENIELITNPSVKYDPDGSAGIINIITKKKKMQGVSGIANLYAGLDDKYGVDLLFNLKIASLNFFISGDYNHRYFPRYNESEQRTFLGDTSYYVLLNGEDQGGFEFKGIRAGMEWDISDRDFMSVSYRIREGRRNRITEQDIREWSEPGADEKNNISFENGYREGSGYSISTNYKHNFRKKGYELIAYLDYHDRKGIEESNNELRDGENILEGSKNLEEGPSTRLRAKLEYILPIREEDKFEAGMQGRFSHNEDNTGLLIYDSEVGDYIVQPEFEHSTLYDRNIYSVYALYATYLNKLGIQGGLRGEYTLYETDTDINDSTYVFDRFDIFPTLHLSFNFTENLQAMASYSRRIDRPRGWYFEPFIVWRDAYNVRKGNPGLIPEYSDSYELGILRTFNESFISFEGFYRVTHNKIERIRSVYSKDVFLHTIYNVGTDYALGAELAFRFHIKKRWELDLSGSIFDYRVEGEYEGISFDRRSFNWDVRWNNTLSFTKTTQMQINSHYNSPSATAQGEYKGNFSVDASMKQSLFERKLSVILQVRDVFGTAKREYTSEGDDFYYYRYHYHKAPIVMLTMIYNFNNYKAKREFRNGDNGNGEGEEF